MSFSSLYKFLLKLKGRGHFLSPKEVQFLKELLNEFSEDEIKGTFERCYKEVIPPSEREKSSLLRCKILFKKLQLKRKKSSSKVYLSTENQAPPTLRELLLELTPQKRKEVLKELKEALKRHNLPPTEENIKGLFRVIVRRYL